MPSLLNKTLCTALAGATLGLSALAHANQAAPRWFDVEVIVFKRNVDAASTTENWPQPQSLSVNPVQPLLAPLFGCEEGEEQCSAPRFSQLPKQIDGSGWPISGPTQRQMLSGEQLELGEEFAKLERHAGFTPLMHLGWREVVAPRNRAKHYLLQAGQDYSSEFPPESELDFDLQLDAQALEEDPFAAFDAAQTEQADETASESDELTQLEPLWELEGGIRIYLQHYLYIESQLLLRAPTEVEQVVGLSLEQEAVQPEAEQALENSVQVEPAGTAEASAEPSSSVVLLGEASDASSTSPSLIQEKTYTTELHSYLFDQKRRVRSGEIHYFDHPLMGMLIQIRRSPKLGEPEASQVTPEAIEQSATETVNSQTRAEAEPVVAE